MVLVAVVDSISSPIFGIAEHVRSSLRGQSRLRKKPFAAKRPGYIENRVNSGATYIERPKLRKKKGPICVGRLQN
jgi:hypothetical protein